MRKSLALMTAISLAVASLSANALSVDHSANGVPLTIKTLKGDKQIKLMKLKFNQSQLNQFAAYQPNHLITYSGNTNLPKVVELGMANVPVLDQGYHGSCVTFAVTGAIDALIGKGDYISQLCSLTLGKYLENESYYPSGWDGSSGDIVLHQIQEFGIVNKMNQQTKTCGSLAQYPVKDENTGTPMSLTDYHAISENFNDFYFKTLLTGEERAAAIEDNRLASATLGKVKEALANSHRLSFGTILQITPYCDAGACAKHKQSSDTWALTKELDLPPVESAGHEMVITGYNDFAVAIDKQGKVHKGLLTLRNSWGEAAGDNGNYYMTYDYFKKYVLEVYELVPMTPELKS